MAEVLKMYKIKPIIDPNTEITVSKCMYKMKNVHRDNESINHVQIMSPVLDISEQNNQTLPEMAELEQRQKKILDQLELLKKQMLNLRSQLNLCSKPEQKHVHTATNLQNLEPISIKADPKYVPYFLLAVRKLWENKIELIVNVHTHSSVLSLPENAQQFADKIISIESRTNLPKLHVSLIWKNVNFDTELMVSSMRAPILGETNILRYLARIDADIFNYNESDIISSSREDAILDICYYLSRSRTKIERQALLRNLNALLGKSNWLTGNSYATISDFATYSVLHQIGLISDLTINMTKWLQRFQNLISAAN